MLHKAWSSREEMPYCFWRSSVKFQGHTAKKIVNFDLEWAFPDCNSSLNSPMATKWRKKLKVAKKRCPIVFLGSSINFQGHTGWKSDDLNPIWVRLLGRSQLSNPSDLPCFCFVLFLFVFLFVCLFFDGGISLLQHCTREYNEKHKFVDASPFVARYQSMHFPHLLFGIFITVIHPSNWHDHFIWDARFHVH